MDKVVFDRLSSFNFNHQQKRDLIDVIKHVSKDDNFEDTFILNINQSESYDFFVKEEDVPDLCKALLDKKQIVAKLTDNEIDAIFIATNQVVYSDNNNNYIFNVSFNYKLDNSPTQYMSVFGNIIEDKITVEISIQDTLIPENINLKFKEIDNNINALKKVATSTNNGLMSSTDKLELDKLVDNSKDVIFTISTKIINDEEYLEGSNFAWALNTSEDNKEINRKLSNRGNFYIDTSLDILGFLPYLKYIKLESIPENVNGVFSTIVPPISELGFTEATVVKVKYNNKLGDWVALWYSDKNIIPITTDKKDGLFSSAYKKKVDTNTKNINDLTNNLSIEQNARTDADKTLQGNIDALKKVATTEANGLMSKEDKVKLDTKVATKDDVTKEQIAREKVDKTLTDNLATEVNERTNAILLEAETRSGADVELSNKINAEVTTREQADTAINAEIQGIKDKGSLFDLFKAAGATLNPDGKTWTMNGITDLTTQELINAYQRRPIGPYLIEVYSNVQPEKKFRTNFPIPSWYNPIISSADRLCYANSFIEVLQIGGTTDIGACFVPLKSCSEWFNGARRLRIVLGPRFAIDAIKFGTNDFRNCQALEDIRLVYLQSNVYFQDSPALNKSSIKHMIVHAGPKSAITITLHPTAYAMAIADPDIQAELEKQPLISLVEGVPSK